MEVNKMNAKVSIKQETKIMHCTCKNEYQDRMYGPGNRVMNATLGKTGKGYRCTVCRSTW